MRTKDADRLREAIKRQPCRPCGGDGIGPTPHKITGKCPSCRGSGRTGIRDFVRHNMVLNSRPAYRSVQRWISGKKAVPPEVLLWLDHIEGK